MLTFPFKHSDNFLNDIKDNGHAIHFILVIDLIHFIKLISGFKKKSLGEIFLSDGPN